MERGVVNAVVTIGGCMVSPGDLIIGDDDGLVALSPTAIRAYIDGAEAKRAREEAWQTSLANRHLVAETFALPAARHDEP